MPGEHFYAAICISVVGIFAVCAVRTIFFRESPESKQARIFLDRIHVRLETLGSHPSTPKEEVDYWILHAMGASLVEGIDDAEDISKSIAIAGSAVPQIMIHRCMKQAGMSQDDLKRRWEEIKSEIMCEKSKPTTTCSNT